MLFTHFLSSMSCFPVILLGDIDFMFAAYILWSIYVNRCSILHEKMQRGHKFSNDSETPQSMDVTALINLNVVGTASENSINKPPSVVETNRTAVKFGARYQR